MHVSVLSRGATAFGSLGCQPQDRPPPRSSPARRAVTTSAGGTAPGCVPRPLVFPAGRELLAEMARDNRARDRSAHPRRPAAPRPPDNPPVGVGRRGSASRAHAPGFGALRLYFLRSTLFLRLPRAAVTTVPAGRVTTILHCRNLRIRRGSQTDASRTGRSADDQRCSPIGQASHRRLPGDGHWAVLCGG